MIRRIQPALQFILMPQPEVGGAVHLGHRINEVEVRPEEQAFIESVHLPFRDRIVKQPLLALGREEHPAPAQRGDIVVFDGSDSFVPASEVPTRNPVAGALAWVGQSIGVVKALAACSRVTTQRISITPASSTARGLPSLP